MELGEEEEEEERGGGGSKGSPEESSAMEDRYVMGGLAWLLEPGVGRTGWGSSARSQGWPCAFLCQGSGDLYVRRRSRDPSFIQLQPVPGPACLRGRRASPAAGQTLTLPQLQRCPPNPLVPAPGWSFIPTGSVAHMGWTG